MVCSFGFCPFLTPCFFGFFRIFASFLAFFSKKTQNFRSMKPIPRLGRSLGGKHCFFFKIFRDFLISPRPHEHLWNFYKIFIRKTRPETNAHPAPPFEKTPQKSVDFDPVFLVFFSSKSKDRLECNKFYRVKIDDFREISGEIFGFPGKISGKFSPIL